MIDRTYKESIIAAVLIFTIIIVLATAIVMFAAPTPACSATLSPETEEMHARQARLRCLNHPDQGCLSQPESENAKAMREYRERQQRLRSHGH